MTNILFYSASLSLIGLIILNLLWEIFYNPLEANGSLMVFKSLILLIPLLGILKKNRYTYQWSSMFILLFFIEGIVRCYSESGISQFFQFLLPSTFIQVFCICEKIVPSHNKISRNGNSCIYPPILV